MAYNNFSDWTKIFGEIKSPAFDVSSIANTTRRNAEAASSLLQLVISNSQENARRLADIARSNAEHALKATKKIVASANNEARTSEQAEFAKNWFEFNLNSARELVELGSKSAQEAFDIVNKHVSEQVKDISEVANQAAHSAKKKAA